MTGPSEENLLFTAGRAATTGLTTQTGGSAAAARAAAGTASRPRPPPPEGRRPPCSPSSSLPMPPGPGTTSSPRTTTTARRVTAGDWLGAGVIELGLDGAGTVERALFQNLLEGQLPDGKRLRLNRTRGSEDRKGIDFTFSAPKSVSIQALVQEDPRIIAAHDAAVKKSLELMQEFAATRKKVARSFLPGAHRQLGGGDLPARALTRARSAAAHPCHRHEHDEAHGWGVACPVERGHASQRQDGGRLLPGDAGRRAQEAGL